MKKAVKPLLLGLFLPALLLADLAPEAPLGLSVAREAAAVVGMPMTPASYAGVARRTTRRVVYAESAAVATTAATTAAAAAPKPPPQPAPAAPPPAPIQSAGPLPVGTVVSALPAGCVSAPISGIEYYLCNGTYYRSAFQGNNLVYVVEKP